MSQIGQGQEVINVYPSDADTSGAWRFDKKMRLSLTDAREVAALLTYLCDLAETSSGEVGP